MPHYLLLFSFLLFSTSCEMLTGPALTEVKIIAQVADDIQVDAAAMQTLKSQLEERLEQAHFTEARVAVSEDGKQLIVQAMVDLQDEKDMQNLKGQFASNTLALWDTYEVKDQEIVKSLAVMPDISGFTPTWETNAHIKTVFGICSDETQLSLILDSLQQLANLPATAKPIWSVAKTESYNDQEGGYELFLVNTKGRKEAPITDQDIKMAEFRMSQISEPEIYFELKEASIPIWADMTRQAASENNRAIAIVVNDRVYSAPMVQSAITGGQCAISGNFSIAEAVELAASLGKNRLSHALEIVSEEVIEKR